MTATKIETELLHGVIIIDKPPGITSAKVVSQVKRAIGAPKVGHAGTLDPFATGVLVCLLNRATRLAGFFLSAEKIYEATLCLGVETDTLDFTGTKTASHVVDAKDISEARIKEVFKKFEGEFDQLVPAFSAVKHKGTRLYKLARKGAAVPEKKRGVTISSLVVEKIDLPRIHFRVACSGGTYIRTLGADIGRQLGCGGHLEALRRTVSSGFDLGEAVTLEE